MELTPAPSPPQGRRALGHQRPAQPPVRPPRRAQTPADPQGNCTPPSGLQGHADPFLCQVSTRSCNKLPSPGRSGSTPPTPLGSLGSRDPWGCSTAGLLTRGRKVTQKPVLTSGPHSDRCSGSAPACPWVQLSTFCDPPVTCLLWVACSLHVTCQALCSGRADASHSGAASHPELMSPKLALFPLSCLEVPFPARGHVCRLTACVVGPGLWHEGHCPHAWPSCILAPERRHHGRQPRRPSWTLSSACWLLDRTPEDCSGSLIFPWQCLLEPPVFVSITELRF